MPTNTYVALETKTLSSAVNTVTFDVSSYTDYTDLQIVFNGGVASLSPNTKLRFNGDTGANYSSAYYEGRQGGAAASGRFTSTAAMHLDYYGSPSSTQSMFIIDIFSFRKTGYYRPVIARYGDTTNSTYSGVGYLCGLWMNTANPITSIQIYPDAVNWNVGSTFTLYGIKSWAAESTPKATGGYVYSDSSYWYHVFLSSSTFTPSQSLSCDYLVVAGGGAGGGDPSNRYQGGGGGAGGLRSTVGLTGGGGTLESPLSLSATSYTVTVGAGGAGSSTTGASGNNSTLSTITATGGGGGGDANETGTSGNGLSGGSGGGGGSGAPGGKTGGSGTANQGYAGAIGVSPAGGSGGGGAGQAGYSGTEGIGGVGGNGVSILQLAQPTATGTGGYYAAGGGGGLEGLQVGGLGGLGGGGNGGYDFGYPGLGGTGSGGGGAGSDSVSARGGNGGSGIVIIRYSK